MSPHAEPASLSARRAEAPAPASPARPWYSQAVIYQLHVRSFFDSDGNGIGDFKGLTQKLPYLHDLGITALWLLPFYPSPLKDDGYDIADYTGINPAYGTLGDFRRFLDAAHGLGLKVITELVINHTSDQHPWFQLARHAPAGSRERDFYVWSDTAERYRQARIIFQDFETSNWAWDPVARAYYWHRFYSHQPDLNFESKDVREAVFSAMEHWLDMGVDGLRLDAVPYLYEREGTNCENLPETHVFLKSLRERVDARYRDRMLLAEANQWPEDASAYFGDGDECHMAFHFPVMPRLFMGARMEDRFPIVDILQQTPPIPEGSQWAVFLRNHDELTLEMVTDEERDYMYRVYARDRQSRINLGIRRRLAPLLENDRRRIELMNALLFSLPGTPVVYYGDEIGMGDNVYLGDRNGVRTPMQWSADRNAGFSRATPQGLFLPVNIDYDYHYESVNVEAQLRQRQSLLWWMRRLISVRRLHPAFGSGSLEFTLPRNPKVLAFIRRDGDDTILVVANLSRFAQQATIPLPAQAGWSVREVFGGASFRTVGEGGYPLTLGPHAFLWLQLSPPRDEHGPLQDERRESLPLVGSRGDWRQAVRDREPELVRALSDWLPRRRWFASKARGIASVDVVETFDLGPGDDDAILAIVRVEPTEGEPERYVVPLVAAPAGETTSDAEAVARGRDAGGAEVVLRDAAGDPRFASALLSFIAEGRTSGEETAQLVGTPTRGLTALAGTEPLQAWLLRGEQSNTSIKYGERLIAKLYRKLDEGVNPDFELCTMLTEQGFAHVPPVAGSISISRLHGEPETLALLQGFVPNQGDGWRLMLEALHRYLDRCLAGSAGADEPGLAAHAAAGWSLRASDELPEQAHQVLGTLTLPLLTLGRRTAELHAALAASPEPSHAPEPYTFLYQKGLQQSLRTLTKRSFALLADAAIPEGAPEHEAVRELLQREDEILARFKRIAERPIGGMRIRTHGDFHLGQVLFTGSDFVLIDLEGEPARTLSERRIKRSPLRDVAGMLRSLHYAAHAGIRKAAEGAVLPPSATPLPWARRWGRWAGEAFLGAYLKAASQGGLLPPSRDDLRLLLETFVLEKAVYEMAYELNNRPDWLAIPLEGIAEILKSPPHGG